MIRGKNFVYFLNVCCLLEAKMLENGKVKLKADRKLISHRSLDYRDFNYLSKMASGRRCCGDAQNPSKV